MSDAETARTPNFMVLDLLYVWFDGMIATYPSPLDHWRRKIEPDES